MKKLFKFLITALIGIFVFASCKTASSSTATTSSATKAISSQPINGRDNVGFTNEITTIKAGSLFKIDVDYSATRSREIVVEIWRNGKWMASQTDVVKKGSGTKTVTVRSNQPLPKGKNYLIKASIRPVGSTWKELFVLKNAEDVIFN